MLEEAIYKKETEYLDDTPYGNILVGFENYIKGSTSSTTNPAAARRKAGLDDNNRVFSRSSTRYADNTDSPNFSSSHTTPAPTPGVEKSFGNVKGEKEDGKSGNATPTSAGGGNRKGEVVKKAAKRPVGEDSETDSGVGKKGRITLASRKGTN
jgi:chromatin modification-related protein EAF6